MSNESDAIIDRAAPPHPAHVSFDVAVVIPTFDRAATILETLKSVLAQTVPVNEIIVVDDCSRDETVRLVEGVRSSIVKVMQNGTNVGAAESRNRGAFATNSSWIAFLDSDDLWAPDKLEQDFRALERNPDAIAIASNHVAVTDGGNLQPATRKERIATPLALLKVENYLGTCSTMTVRRDVLVSIGGFTPFLKSCQDWDLWMRIARNGRIAIARPGSVFYRVASNANISLDGKKRRAGHVHMWKSAIRPSKRDTSARATLALTFADIAANLNKRRSFRRLCMYSMKFKLSNAVVAGLMLSSSVGASDYRTYRNRVVRRLGAVRAIHKIASEHLFGKRTSE